MLGDSATLAGRRTCRWRTNDAAGLEIDRPKEETNKHQRLMNTLIKQYTRGRSSISYDPLTGYHTNTTNQARY